MLSMDPDSAFATIHGAGLIDLEFRPLSAPLKAVTLAWPYFGSSPARYLLIPQGPQLESPAPDRATGDGWDPPGVQLG